MTMSSSTMDVHNTCELETLMRLTGNHSVDIEFENLSYTVSDKRHGRRCILKGVSGNFRAGELTAVMGPSGAGKTTLVNTLSGITSGATGSIRTNGSPRDIKRFRKMSSYIMQEDLLQTRLTVRESMNIAAELKLGHTLSADDKIAVVQEVSSSLGLNSCMETRSENLSGGQRKRLSVALELVSNPPIIFLDEPTTGLDVVAIKNLVNLLRMLASQGRTIICTIHQPSASLLNLFDRLYVIADGLCVYQGGPSRLVPFMSGVGLHCPITHNPADFVIEVLHLDKENVISMSRAIGNGKLSELDCHNDSMTLLESRIKANRPNNDCDIEFCSTFFTQFTILLKRRLLQVSRNTTSLWIQLIHHIISALLIGGIFFDIGQNANTIFVNFKFYICVMVFYLYTYIMVPVLLYPTEVKLLKREYFNRWYGLKSYYAALTIASLPTLVPMTTLFAVITYFMTNQPIEIVRFGWFLGFCLLISISSESIGLTVGSVFSITNGSIVAPATVAPILALCVYGMGYGQAVDPMMAIVMNMSFLRYAIVGLTTNVYGDRDQLFCPAEETYCHYRNPKLFLRDLGMEHSSFYLQVIGMTLFAVLFKIVAFTALRFRLTTEFSNKILNYIAKVLRRK